MSKFKTSFLLVSLFATAMFGLSSPVFAQPATTPTTCGQSPTDPLGLDCAAATGLKANDPRIIASRLINVVLGLLGMIATVLIIYAGFLWMTAGGNEENATKAKSIIYGAVIGLIIILSAWSISAYVINNLTNVTGIT